MKGGKIVIVDDDKAFVEAVSIYLHDHGFHVIKAHTARQAIQECARQPFDLVVVDVHLPDIEGPELVSQLHRRNPSAAVLLISSDDSPENTRRCLSSPARAFMTKPLVPHELLAAISRALQASRNAYVPG